MVFEMKTLCFRTYYWAMQANTIPALRAAAYFTANASSMSSLPVGLGSRVTMRR